jgi:hypothetical protein
MAPLIGLVLLVAAMAAYVTSVICRLAARFQRPVRWYFAVACVFVSGGLATLFAAIGFSYPPGDFGKGIYVSQVLCMVFFPACFVSIIPVCYVVSRFQERQKNEGPVA